LLQYTGAILRFAPGNPDSYRERRLMFMSEQDLDPPQADATEDDKHY